MKNIFLALTLILTTHYAQAACEKVAGACLTEDMFSAETAQYLQLEAELGQNTYDLNHVNIFKVFRAPRTTTLELGRTSAENLQELVVWATQTLGIYEAPEYTGAEVLRQGKKMTKAQFKKFMKNAFMSPQQEQIDEFSAAQKDQLQLHSDLELAAMFEIESLLFPDGVSKISVYELLDNNNENVQDAQYAIVSNGVVVIMNRFWWL